MKIETHTLPNNIRLVHVPDKSDVAYLGAIINTGTRDELTNESGLAHLTEHMLFKGTSKRNSTQIINRIEDVGGDLNAYTAKEETVIYSVFLKKYISYIDLAAIKSNSNIILTRNEKQELRKLKMAKK